MDCDPNALAALAKCLQCLSPTSLLEVQTYLLCQIGNSAAISGAGNFSGAGSPEGVVTANAGATYVDTATGSLYWKRTSGVNTGWVVILTNLSDLGSLTVTDSVSPSISIRDGVGRILNLNGPSATQAAFIGTPNSASFSIGTGNSLAQLFLDVGGNIGIGNQAPGATLDVNPGNVRASAGFLNGTGGVKWVIGAGDPNTVVTAPVGSLYSRTDGGALTSLYVKESGVGATGWVGK